MVGLGENEDREARVLNRILRVTEAGWQYEPDQRHAEMIVSEMSLENAKSVKTPGEPEGKTGDNEENELDKAKGTRFSMRSRS